MNFNNFLGIQIDWVPFLLYDFSEDFVFVTSEKNAEYLASILRKTVTDTDIINLNFFNSEIYENSLCNTGVFARRAKALSEILFSKKRKIIVTTIESINYKVPHKDYFLKCENISVGDDLQISNIKNILMEFGYTRSEIVLEHGQFSIRGGIVDVFPPLSDRPIRIDFLGNKIDALREFSPQTQISENSIYNTCLTKCSEIILNKESVEFFRTKIRNKYQIDAIENGYFFNGIEWFLPYFHKKTVSILEYFDKKTKFILDFESSKLNRILFETKIRANDNLFSDSISDICQNFDFIELNPFANNDKFKLKDKNYNIRIESEKAELLNSVNNKTIFSVSSNGALYIMKDILSGISFQQIESFYEETSSNINLIISPLNDGFISDKITVYTEKELFGEILKSSGKKKSKDIFKQYLRLSVGDYVVHERHGIAVFDGLKNITVSGISHDFLVLLYKNNDKLYVPVENISLISRYGDAESSVIVDVLKGNGWSKRKGDVRKKLIIIASGLLQLAAKRKLYKLDPLDIPAEYDEFCKGFGHIETEDQQSAIDDVLADLRSDIPMDRLVCGDVGFGKTEVAIRGAFIAAFAEKQVVLLAPTTILVAQHFKNFVKRFEKYNIKICQLSRFVSRTRLKENISAIETGEAKIIIATHSVLSSKIKFKNLGLIIIDEEQHFGVKQKEFLKTVRADAHFMTLSATPIPRTLQLAMSGIKDLSLLATPPLERRPVRAIVCEFENETIEKAIENEIKTGGQVFFITPRVEYLDEIYGVASSLFPKISIEKAHGQSKNLEEILQKFCENKVKILVATNIVDSGIDISNANTIIIHRCDLFGLAQLYQLKGRVGRANKQAYAYFLLSKTKLLSENSKKRIEILQSLCNLGSGFTLSSHDLDVRGAGNLLGEEQAGYIKEVGIELYQTMLQEAILMAKSGKISDEERKSSQINLGVPIYIPETYIDDSNLRLSIYRRIGDLETIADAEKMEFELADRFGKIPHETINLLSIIKIKINCQSSNIEKLDVGPKGFSFSFFDNICPNPKVLVEFFNTNIAIWPVKITSDHKIVITKKWKSSAERTADILTISSEITKCFRKC
ncbi:transcription-repair-coupling factor [Alphaproteobacteria bacterium]|nr:transcription-repair-coupling factor [Alphaproteobacteria bacterium]